MKLETLLQDRSIPFERHSHTTTYTSQSLAHEEHVTGYMVAKPVIVKTSSGFAMCVLPAPKRLDLQRVGEVLQDPEVRLATESEMAEAFPDCELGAEPPVGVLFGLTTVMDEGLQEDDYLLMQAGTHRESVKLSRADWERLCEPIVASIATG